MQLLKQSTAVTVKIGPFLDSTDGDTAETGLTIAQADVLLSKNGGAFAQKNEATSCTHDTGGMYGCPLDATDTGTLGRLQLFVHESGALPVWHDFMVVTANVYDSLCSTDKLEVDVTQLGGVAQSATDLKDFADEGYDPSTNKVEAVKLVDTTTTNSDMRGTDNAALASTALSNATWTDARAGYLDNLNLGGLAASQADVQGITQASRVRVCPPPLMERPDSGSTSFRIWIYHYNEQHQAEDLDSNPTVSAENNEGTSRSGNLGTVTKPGGTTGQYYVDYTVASSHAIEGLVFKVAATEDGVTTNYVASSIVVDTTAVDFTAADRTKLEAVYNKLPSATYLVGTAQADGSGYSTHSAADVWTVGTRALTDKAGFSLADGSITASTFDESTAFPIKSADSGATQIARVGADSDTLETLSDQIDAIVDRLDGDWITDINQTPWQVKLTKKGVPGTVYVTKNATQPDGSNVTSENHIVGNLKEA